MKAPRKFYSSPATSPIPSSFFSIQNLSTMNSKEFKVFFFQLVIKYKPGSISSLNNYAVFWIPIINFKRQKASQAQWFKPVILVTWEVEIKKMAVQGQPGQKV
jgi:hypothetical protein